MKKYLSRRDFLKALAVISGVAGVGLAKILSNPEAKGLGQQLTDYKTFLPFTVFNEKESPIPTTEPSPSPLPPPVSPRVAHVRSEDAHNWNTTDFRYWNYENQEVIDDMADLGIMALTGTSTVADAYRSILPNYQPGEGIAVKVNFNNATSCDDESGKLDAIIEPVNALVRGLKQAGVQEQDIWIYDAIRYLPNRFVNYCLYNGVKFYDVGCRLRSSFSSSDPTATVVFNPPPGIPLPEVPIKISDILVNAKYVINMPIMRAHGCVGVTLAFKHHYGSIDGPMYLHQYCYGDGTVSTYSDDYSPFVDLYLNQNILGKTVLTIGDGIFGHPTTNVRAPIPWVTFGNGFPKSLFFSRDPVAIDCVMADFINAERAVPDATYRYLQIAHEAGLGLYEKGDPWGSGYSEIDYVKIDL